MATAHGLGVVVSFRFDVEVKVLTPDALSHPTPCLTLPHLRQSVDAIAVAPAPALSPWRARVATATADVTVTGMATVDPTRRPLKSRNQAWAKALTTGLCRAGVWPDVVSIGSVVVAAGAGVALWGAGRSAVPVACGLFIIAAACAQLRLLCNLLDGMIAVETGRRSPVGEIYNDLPDRVSDVLILVGAGYAVGQPAGITLGWAAATLAVLTAYIRVTGRALGTPSYFLGPMAKPHRMALLTAACVIASVACWWGVAGQVMAVALAVMIAATAWTCARRLRRIMRDLREGAR